MDNNEQAQPSEQTAKGGGSAVKIIGVVVVLIIIAYLAWEFGLKNNNASEQGAVSPTPSAQTSNQEIEAESTAAYKDGTYEAIGEYTNPASREELNVTVTLAGGTITEASFTGTPDNPTTERMQDRVNEALATEVVGKSIDEVNLDVVNGSSLTPQGFMDALSKIKEEAKS